MKMKNKFLHTITIIKTHFFIHKTSFFVILGIKQKYTYNRIKSLFFVLTTVKFVKKCVSIMVIVCNFFSKKVKIEDFSFILHFNFRPIVLITMEQ